METSKLFRSIVGYGLALTAVVELGAACSKKRQDEHMREGANPAPPPDACVERCASRVQGRVVEADGLSAFGATVTITGSDGAPGATVTTGVDGTFAADLVIEDTRKLRSFQLSVKTADGRVKTASVAPDGRIEIHLDPATTPADAPPRAP